MALSKRFDLPEGTRLVALAEVSFEVAGGEFVTLLGPSGCGKTTLLNILSGLDHPSAGEVRFGGSAGSAGRPRTGHVFQDARLLPWLTVLENVRFGLDGSRRETLLRAREWIRRVGLAGFEERYPGQLSTGMQQRVAVARALAVEPQVLLMDEPFSALDELTARRLRDQLVRLWRWTGCTVLFVTHNPLEAVYLSDRVFIMSPSPGRVRREMELREALPRPRDPRDPRIWEYAGLAVEALAQGLEARERDQVDGGERAGGG